MRIRFATYNIHRAIGLDRRFRPERVKEILAEHDPDVVLLQEVDNGVPRSNHLNLARELAEGLGYPHFALGPNVSVRGGAYGNATLSRFPILRDRNIDLRIGRRKRRGCQHTTLLLDDGEPPLHMEVFNLHLGLSARERRQQVGLLSRSQEFSELDHDVPCVVGGDFNDWRSLLRPFFVETLDFVCATDRPSARGARSILTYPSFSPTGALDKIYYRGRLKLISAHACRHQLARVASDHLPVILEFDVAAQRGAAAAATG